MLYQICYLNKDTTEEGKKTLTLIDTDLLTAPDLSTAYATVQAEHPEYFPTTTAPADDDDGEGDTDTDTTLRIYPYATPTDGKGIMALSRRVVREYEKWELRNDNAVLEPSRRSNFDRENLASVANLAIVAVFAEHPNIDMHSLSRLAFSAVATEQKSKDRNSEREYHTDYHPDSLKMIEAKATCPELDHLMRKAIETADLTARQMEVVTAYTEGLSVANIAEHTDTTKRAVACALYSAQYKVLIRMIELDPTLRTFAKAKITAEDVAERVEILRKRARVKK